MTAADTPADAARAAMTAPTRPRGFGLQDRLILGLLLGGARVLQALPDGVVYRIAAGIGSLAWLGMPARRRLVRENLQRVLRYVAEDPAASVQVKAAAGNTRALDNLARSAFQHWVRAYVESAVASRYSAQDLLARVHEETPEVIQEALGLRIGDAAGRLFVGFHFGAIELAALYASRTGKVPVSGPMESVDNPVMRAYFERVRQGLGIDILPLDDAAAELKARLQRGEVVALVADRAVRGAGSRVQLFGAPARLPLGVAVLTAESPGKTYVVGMRRTGWGRWSVRLDRIDIPDGLSRRDRLRFVLQEEVRLLERMVAQAPEQWWSLFFPIWDAA